MWICQLCGFDSAQEGAACPMCGADEGARPEDAPTLDFDPSDGYLPVADRYERVLSRISQ